MAIAPITGKLRKHFWLDVGVALGLGLGGAYAYWLVQFYHRNTLLSVFFPRYGVHLKACELAKPGFIASYLI
jgi:hypothetical protein